MNIEIYFYKLYKKCLIEKNINSLQYINNKIDVDLYINDYPNIIINLNNKKILHNYIIKYYKNDI